MTVNSANCNQNCNHRTPKAYGCKGVEGRPAAVARPVTNTSRDCEGLFNGMSRPTRQRRQQAAS
jgi:hypothetical protein